jgi:hypothetical protein
MVETREILDCLLFFFKDEKLIYIHYFLFNVTLMLLETPINALSVIVYEDH